MGGVQSRLSYEEQEKQQALNDLLCLECQTMPPNPDKIKELLNQGADINSLAGGYGHYNALHSALLYGQNLDFIKFLIDECGADIEVAAKFDFSFAQILRISTHYATDTERINVLKYLLSKGLKVKENSLIQITSKDETSTFYQALKTVVKIQQIISGDNIILNLSEIGFLASIGEKFITDVVNQLIQTPSLAAKENLVLIRCSALISKALSTKHAAEMLSDIAHKFDEMVSDLPSEELPEIDNNC